MSWREQVLFFVSGVVRVEGATEREREKEEAKKRALRWKEQLPKEEGKKERKKERKENMSGHARKGGGGEKIIRTRENGWNMNFRNEKLPKYNALHDSNLRSFFESKNIQTHLYTTGLIDANGRVINLEKNKSKLHIIDQEFKAAERAERWRREEEEEMRRRVQQKRYETLEKARRLERLERIKEDREIRRQIVAASRDLLNIPVPKTMNKKKKKKKTKKKKKEAINEGSSSFFVTEGRSEE